ncbi:MAG: HIT domain-containing protein, partial [Candidatus Omnitrophota bacterium]
MSIVSHKENTLFKIVACSLIMCFTINTLAYGFDKDTFDNLRPIRARESGLYGRVSRTLGNAATSTSEVPQGPQDSDLTTRRIQELSRLVYDRHGDRSALLHESANFMIITDRHPISEGHLLILPKTDAVNLSELNERQLRELQQLQENVREVLKRVYKNEVIFFEHGPSCAISGKAGWAGHCVDIAHLHAVPVPLDFDLIEDLDDPAYAGLLETPLEIGSLSELGKQFAQGPYFLYEDTKGRRFVVGIKGQTPSQFLRILAANRLGNEDLGDWKKGMQDVPTADEYDRLYQSSNEALRSEFKAVEDRPAAGSAKGQKRSARRMLIEERLRQQGVSARSRVALLPKLAPVKVSDVVDHILDHPVRVKGRLPDGERYNYQHHMLELWVSQPASDSAEQSLELIAQEFDRAGVEDVAVRLREHPGSRWLWSPDEQLSHSATYKLINEFFPF